MILQLHGVLIYEKVPLQKEIFVTVSTDHMSQNNYCHDVRALRLNIEFHNMIVQLPH